MTYRAWLLRTGELVFEARSGMWVRDCEGYVRPYPEGGTGRIENGKWVTERLPLPEADELTQHVIGEVL